MKAKRCIEPPENLEEGGQIGGSIGGSIEGLTERQQEILRLLKDNPKVSYRNLAKKLEINDSAIKKHLENLKQAGVVERVGGTRGYWLVKV